MPPLPVPDLPVPTRWARTLDDWPARLPSQLVAGLETARCSGRLDELRRADGQYPDFTATLRAALAGSARSVTLSFSEPRWTLAVVSTVGALLGHVGHPVDPTLGGSVSEVPTGGTDRYEQNWHTDSTPGSRPIGGLSSAYCVRTLPCTSLRPACCRGTRSTRHGPVQLRRWESFETTRLHGACATPGWPSSTLRCGAPYRAGSAPRWTK